MIHSSTNFTSIQSEKEREGEREVESKRESSKHTLRQLKGVLLFYKKHPIGRKGKTQNEPERYMCPNFPCPYISYVYFSKTMGWGVGSWPSIPLLVADIYMYVFNQRMVFVQIVLFKLCEGLCSLDHLQFDQSKLEATPAKILEF